MIRKPRNAAWRLPFSSKLFSLAGQSLRVRTGMQFDEIVACLMIVVAFWLVCMAEWTQKFAGANPDPRFWTALSCVVTIFGGVRIFRLYPKIPNPGTRESGARRITAILDRVRSKGFSVFHDLAGDRFPGDLVVVGPSGIYAIERKTRHGSGTIEYPNENELIFQGRIKDGNPLRQAREAARLLQLRLNECLREECWVKPVVLFVGDWVVSRQSGDFAADVLTVDQLEEYFERGQPDLTSGEITRLCSHLERLGSLTSPE
jgi:Nuclease-related domain